jgi:2',3'-cyclic-nucleotide 2'-phosphodiesterase (5'-nucleotidase family)
MFIIFSCFLSLPFSGSVYTRAISPGILTIPFTHDLHSHFLPRPVFAKDGARIEQGGYAKVVHLIKERRADSANRRW